MLLLLYIRGPSQLESGEGGGCGKEGIRGRYVKVVFVIGVVVVVVIMVVVIFVIVIVVVVFVVVVVVVFFVIVIVVVVLVVIVVAGHPGSKSALGWCQWWPRERGN